MFKGTSSTFYALNMNKKDVAIDMKQPEGIALVKDLVKKSDVVVQNFATGAMERLGLGYEELKKLKPDIIYAALSGFGQTGPYRSYASYAAVAEAFSGHTYATGKNYDVNGPPIPMAGALGDLGPAIYAAFAVVAALRHRDRTGEGQMIDVSQIDAMVAFNCCETVAYDLFKESPITRRKNRPQNPDHLWGIVPVKDGWIQIAGERPKAIDALKQELGVETVTLDMMKEKLGPMTRNEAFEWLVGFGVPAAPIYEAYEGLEDPQLKARNSFVEVDHPVAGRYKVPNFPVKFSATPGEVKTAAPVLGQHTEEVLRNLLKKTPQEIDAMEKAGTIVCWRG
jgi:crotonobetainyl-CoA:carnitine CoA-transferase CaiB-like acyl-CoA transferase